MDNPVQRMPFKATFPRPVAAFLIQNEWQICHL